jgi:hypothetical protein
MDHGGVAIGMEESNKIVAVFFRFGGADHCASASLFLSQRLGLIDEANDPSGCRLRRVWLHVRWRLGFAEVATIAGGWTWRPYGQCLRNAL